MSAEKIVAKRMVFVERRLGGLQLLVGDVAFMSSDR